jgi:hypothetical protein
MECAVMLNSYSPASENRALRRRDLKEGEAIRRYDLSTIGEIGS